MENVNDSFYSSGKYLKKHPSWGKEDSLWKVRQIFKAIPAGFLHKFFKNQKITVVDIGCGAGGVIGNFTEILKKKGFEVICATGLDISEDPLKIARKEWGAIDFAKGQLQDYGRNFDIGLLIDVVEHVKNPDAFLRVCGTYCKYLVLHIPLDDNYNFKLRNRYEYLAETFGHINYFNGSSLLAFLRRNGMEIINYIYTPGFMLPSSRVHLPAKIGFLPRLILSSVSKAACARLLGGYSVMVLSKSKIFEKLN